MTITDIRVIQIQVTMKEEKLVVLEKFVIINLSGKDEVL